MTAVAELEGKLDRLERLRALRVAEATGRAPWEPLPHQQAPPGDWFLWLLLAGRGAGKALSLNTRLPTPTGWTTMADVDVGDELLDENGRPCRVTLTSPVMENRDCYRVAFSDGSEIVADAEHRWVVWPHAYRKALARRVGGGDPRRPQNQPRVGPLVLTTAQMRDELRQGSRGDLNLAVPVAAPLRLQRAALPIDPYVLGVWLGDGHLHRAAVTTMEPEVVQGLHAAGYALAPDKQQNAGLATTYAIRAADRSKARSLHRLLRNAGLLGNEKRIPPAYLRASAEQRERLLEGLMDTDGYVAEDGACEFAVVDLVLARDVFELVVSLGWKATSSIHVVDGRDVYRVRFNPDRPVTTVARKLARAREPGGAQSSRHRHRMVVSVTRVESVPVKCVAVDSPSHLFLAGPSMIPTHNTDACASYFDRWMRRHPKARGSIIAPTIGDAAEACVYGPSGLLAHNPTVRITTRVGATLVVWPNGSEARLFGTHTKGDVDRLRAGGNRGLVWAEELAAWPNLADAWTNMELGLREGPRPHVIASTTPKTRPKLRELMKARTTVLTRASTYDNPHLPEATRQRLLDKYEGTRLGRQELLGQYLEDVEGALWTYETLLRAVVTTHPDLARAVVGVDPSGGDSEGNDEQGIIVAGLGVDGHGYILDDRSCKLSPDGWGRRAVQAYVDHRCDRIVGETNFGGDMVLSTVKVAAQHMGHEVATKKVTASRGKVTRAEPIAALYEQDRVHHVVADGDPADKFEQLEEQQRFWTPDSGWSPDRMDAAVWGLTELMLGHVRTQMRTHVPRGRIDGGGRRTAALGLPGLG